MTELRRYLSGAIAGFLLAFALVGQTAHASYAPSLIRSIEASSTTLAAANSNTTTLSTTLTNVNKAFITNRGCTLSDNSHANMTGANDNGQVTLTNTTTVTVTRVNNTGGTMVCYWTVIEFY